MSESSGTSDQLDDNARRTLRFNSPQDVVADLESLRNGPVRSLKKWSLPQACWHVAMVIDGNLNKPDSDVRTPEQEQKKAKFFGTVLGPTGMPEDMPIPAHLDPPPECGSEQIDRLIAAFEKLARYPHAFIAVGGCGPVSVDEVRQLHLAHAAHHLSFQKPAVRRQSLSFADIDAIIADIRRLQRGYVKTGNWTLAQACWHLNATTSYLMSPPPADAAPTPPDAAQRLAAIFAAGKIPDGLVAPEKVVPPEKCGDDSIEAYIATLQRLKTFAGPFTPHRLFGQFTAEQAKKHTLLHATRHLSFLVPTATVIPVK